MLFNSIEFFLFFPIVTALYFILPHQWRWLMLLIASCVFYMFFVPVYIFILLATILVDYVAAMQIEKSSKLNARRWLIGSIISTILILAVFKYFNFFIGNFNGIANLIGWNYSLNTLSILLPIGLSFYLIVPQVSECFGRNGTYLFPLGSEITCTFLWVEIERAFQELR
jgi:D-alanyl-lipoteichoic acid acyltransferase DltB (MBOAT superfamily)